MSTTNYKIMKTLTMGGNTYEIFDEQARNDIAILKESVPTKATAILSKVEGDSIIVNDSSNEYIKTIRVFGKTVQEGVPSPNLRSPLIHVDNPIISIIGKNLFEVTGTDGELSGVYSIIGSDGTIMLTGTTFNTFNQGFANTFPAGSYTYSCCPEGGNETNGYFASLSVNGKTIYTDTGSSTNFTLDEESTVEINITVRKNVTLDDVVFKPMICRSEVEDNTFEPYFAQYITVHWGLSGIPVESGGNYVDSNGQQWICDDIDFARGSFVSRIGIESDLQFTLVSGHKVGNSELFAASVSNSMEGSANTMVLSNCLPTTLSALSENINGVYQSDGSIFARIENVSDVDTFNELMAGNEFCYVKSSPREFGLDNDELAIFRNLKTNYPVTTVINRANAGMALEYRADTRLYLDHLPKATSSQVQAAVDAWLENHFVNAEEVAF